MEIPQALSNRLALVTAWIAMLVTSNLAVILFTELDIGMPEWWPWIHVSALFLILLAPLVIEQLKRLQGFILILMSIFIIGYGGGWDWGFVPFVRNSAS